MRNPIDAFILAKLEAHGLKPRRESRSRDLYFRRVTFDLIGLPPTPEEMAAFKADCNAAGAEAPQAALEKVVERLLASPHYGERWGRHWLDVARFAESNGYEFDEVRPDAWRYRDYVIRSFNADKPYDRFVQEQLAGDELFPGDTQALIATGFNLLGPDMTDASSQIQRRQNTLDDMTDTTGLAFLGMTIACARCHDHKFEPIPQTDYFRLQAFFTGAVFKKDASIASKEKLAQYAVALKEYRGKTRPVDEAARQPRRTRTGSDCTRKKLANACPKPPRPRIGLRKAATHRRSGRPGARNGPSAERSATAKSSKAMSAGDLAEHQKLKTALKAFDGFRPLALPVAMALANPPGPAPKTYLLERGDASNPGAEVRPGFPSRAGFKDQRPVDAAEAGDSAAQSPGHTWPVG